MFKLPFSPFAAVAAASLSLAAGCAQSGNASSAPAAATASPVINAAVAAEPVAAPQQQSHVTGVFKGAKVNGGYVTHSTNGTKSLLTLSSDFKVPDTPAPHWQVVDSRGNTYLLQRLVIKGDKFNRTIEVPSYVPDVANVQIWCAWAEALLGEASFASPVH
jgi:hypothetical protein